MMSICGAKGRRKYFSGGPVEFAVELLGEGIAGGDGVGEVVEVASGMGFPLYFQNHFPLFALLVPLHSATP